MFLSVWRLPIRGGDDHDVWTEVAPLTDVDRRRRVEEASVVDAGAVAHREPVRTHEAPVGDRYIAADASPEGSQEEGPDLAREKGEETITLNNGSRRHSRTAPFSATRWTVLRLPRQKCSNPATHTGKYPRRPRSLLTTPTVIKQQPQMVPGADVAAEALADDQCDDVAQGAAPGEHPGPPCCPDGRSRVRGPTARPRR